MYKILNTFLNKDDDDEVRQEWIDIETCFKSIFNDHFCYFSSKGKFYSETELCEVAFF